MQELIIRPILGRKTDVAADDPSLFVGLQDGTVATHDVGGLNFDLNRTRNVCTKSFGDTQWSNSATTGTDRCQGIYELYDGTNRNRLIVYNGKVYAYDSSRDPQDKSGAVTWANSDSALFSFITVGDYAVWADNGTTTSYKWKHGDASASKLEQGGGTEYIFKYLVPFQRRVIGLYSDQTDGDIEIRWSSSWPGTAITSMTFASANQLYMPNDDVIVGGALMGRDRCFIYCEDSINELIYYPDYSSPFRLYTVVPSHGGINQQSIVTVQGVQYTFCPDYGFIAYGGGREVIPISDDIEPDVQAIDTDYYGLLVGDYIPFTKEIVWTVPASGSATPSQLWYYNVITKQWRFEDKSARFIRSMRMYDAYTWNDLISYLQGQGYANPTWANLRTDKGSTVRWGDITDFQDRLCYSNNDGHLHYLSGDSATTGNLDGYRIEPILALASKGRRSKLLEIWFGLNDVGSFNIDVYHRSGSTVGEVEAASWSSLGTVSANSPEYPVLRCDKNDYLHQLKWETNLNNEKFGVTDIRLKYKVEGEY